MATRFSRSTSRPSRYSASPNGAAEKQMMAIFGSTNAQAAAH
jgi:hypothetical protein